MLDIFPPKGFENVKKYDTPNLFVHINIPTICFAPLGVYCNNVLVIQLLWLATRKFHLYNDQVYKVVQMGVGNPAEIGIYIGDIATF